MSQSAFHNVLGKVVKAQDRKTQSARANARAFDQFAAIASVSAQKTVESTAHPSDKSKQKHDAAWRYVGDNLLEREAEAEAPTTPVLTVSRLKACIEQGLSVNELKALRRRFARECHPDRVSESQRMSATQDMTLVNTMIDRAIHELER